MLLYDYFSHISVAHTDNVDTFLKNRHVSAIKGVVACARLFFDVCREDTAGLVVENNPEGSAITALGFDIGVEGSDRWLRIAYKIESHAFAVGVVLQHVGALWCWCRLVYAH